MAVEVTLIIPTIPERKGVLLNRAVASAKAQTYPFSQIIVEQAGPSDDAAATRQRGVDQVDTPWVSFLDDDDELEPHHLSSLVKSQQTSGADIVYSWFTPYNQGRRMEEEFGMLLLNGKSALGIPWSHLQKHELNAGRWCFHLNALFRTELIRKVGGFHAPGRGLAKTYLSEDLDLEQRLVATGARVHHCAMRTWRWYFWEGRTRGQPERLR